MHRLVILLLAALAPALPPPAHAETQTTAGEFLASLHFQRGTVVLPGDIATIQVPTGFRYLSPADTERVLVTAWGNPPGTSTLGMLVPGEDKILSDDGWAVIISYEEDGYVSDADANAIDYDTLLQTMREQVRAANQERAKAGYEPVELVGWAVPPRYDNSSNKLYWAKELKFGESPVNALNYNVRVLGRKGVLVLNLVAMMPQLGEVAAAIPKVLAMTNFQPGHRYSDFDPDMDKVAAYGIGALIAGKVAAKTGLFAKLGALLLALKKFWMLALVALFAFVGRLFKRSRSDDSHTASP